MTTATQSKPFKITYSAINADMTEFHRQFDEALQKMRNQMGKEHPLYIGGKAIRSQLPLIVDTSPIDTSVTIGKFASATPAHVEQAVQTAKQAQKAWAKLPWQDRLK